jgi:hypothetical protein
MKFYWDSRELPEVIYIQSSLPSILPYASNSTYARAMISVENIESYADHLARVHDDAANMDWLIKAIVARAY